MAPPQRYHPSAACLSCPDHLSSLTWPSLDRFSPPLQANPEPAERKSIFDANPVLRSQSSRKWPLLALDSHPLTEGSVEKCQLRQWHYDCDPIPSYQDRRLDRCCCGEDWRSLARSPSWIRWFHQKAPPSCISCQTRRSPDQSSVACSYCHPSWCGSCYRSTVFLLKVEHFDSGLFEKSTMALSPKSWQLSFSPSSCWQQVQQLDHS